MFMHDLLILNTAGLFADGNQIIASPRTPGLTLVVTFANNLDARRPIRCLRVAGLPA